MNRIGDSRYVIKSLVHASEVLRAFKSEGEVLRLRDVVQRTALNKMTCFRLLYTLHQCGFIEKVSVNAYRTIAHVPRIRRYTIGYAAHGQDASFPREVGAGLARAAEKANVELVVVNNRYDSKAALRCADQLVSERVDLAIEFQADELVAATIAGKFLEANIPIIAVDIPHPGAIYFGGNNYQAGLIAGHHLGRWANKHWAGEAEEIILIEIGRAGSLPHARIQGMLAGINQTLHAKDQCRTIHLDGDGTFEKSQECIRKCLRTSKSERILVGAATDPSALGALRAFEEAGRAAHCAIAGQNADLEGRAELRKPRTRLIGSVAYFPERYGEGIIRLALDILAHKPTPPAVFMKHQLITPENVDQVYPNDALMGIA